jgi:hypothetical protein
MPGECLIKTKSKCLKLNKDILKRALTRGRTFKVTRTGIARGLLKQFTANRKVKTKLEKSIVSGKKNPEELTKLLEIYNNSKRLINNVINYEKDNSQIEKFILRFRIEDFFQLELMIAELKKEYMLYKISTSQIVESLLLQFINSSNEEIEEFINIYYESDYIPLGKSLRYLQTPDHPVAV